MCGSLAHRLSEGKSGSLTQTATMGLGEQGLFQTRIYTRSSPVTFSFTKTHELTYSAFESSHILAREGKRDGTQSMAEEGPRKADNHLGRTVFTQDSWITINDFVGIEGLAPVKKVM
jgi:hypothetical protein